MGLGRFKDGRFDLIVVGNFPMTDTEVIEWQRSFVKGSELWWDASEGQIQYGRLFFCDDSIGLDTADVILHPSGDPSYASFLGLGSSGPAMHLMPYARFEVLSQIHEMGHYALGLGDEYAAPLIPEEIDTSVDPPDNSTIPLVGSVFADNALVGRNAVLNLGGAFERRFIIGNDATSVRVNDDYPESPLNDTDGLVQYEFPAECADDIDANFCIMEHSREAAGTLDEDGNWTPATDPVSEFCSDSNHDPDGDTEQTNVNASSCWSTIVTRARFDDLTVPDPGAPGPGTGSAEPEWIVLDKQPRFSVVIDRSGSMDSGHKMADAQHGAQYWLEYCAVGTDLLSIVAYDDQIETTLDQTEVGELGGLGPTVTAINALTPRGATNIRDALTQARGEIESLATRAAVQVVLLLTDGIHNFPSGTVPSEVLPEFIDGGIRIYSLAVGDEDEVDMTELNKLAQTGGRTYAVGDDEAGEIENKMVEINAEVRGGIITTAPFIFPDSAPGPIDGQIGPAADLPLHDRPPLKPILAVAGALPNRRIKTLTVPVEESADRVSFTVTHPDTADVWLYLLDPDGNEVDTSPGSAATHVASSAPHEFIVVKNPMPGRWTLVAVRPRPGPAFVARMVAGGENRHLQVFARTAPVHGIGQPVPLFASARWGHELTGLRVTARITAPSGARHSIALTDTLASGTGSGEYSGVFTPAEQGRHHAVVTIGGSSAASMANPYRQLSHFPGDSFDASLEVPRFTRSVVLDFYVGKPPRPRRRREKPRGSVPGGP